MSDSNAECHNGTQDMVDKLLAERQEMLVMFCTVAGLQPFGDKRKQDIVQALQSFCRLLIDYSAFFHFEIYECIVGGKERRQRVVDVAREVYPRIVEVSEVVVEFNDRYDASDHRLDLGHLDNDLSKLGEEIATRVEVEDRIVNALLAK